MAKKKTWREKHDGHNNPAKVVTLDKPMAGLPPGATLVIATPGEISDFFRGVPAGETRSVEDLRAALATAHGADGACPLTTGIFCRIASEAALEALEHGAPRDDVAPFWRVIEPTSPLARKLSCGPGFIREQRSLEAGS